MRSIVSIAIALTLLLNVSCTTKEQKEEGLAKQYCTTCHMFPEPSLLDKERWNSVMQQMAFRMGVDISGIAMLTEEDAPYVLQTLPNKPMISIEEFDAIRNYYQREAPDSLVLPEIFPAKDLDQFEVIPQLVVKERAVVSMLRADTIKKHLWLGSRRSKLYQYDYNFKLIDSVRLTSPASSIVFDNDGPYLTLMGIMDPNDQPKGSVVAMDNNFSPGVVIDSIKRPVYLERVDLNNDKQEDIVVCAFGNYGGALLVFENKGNGKYIRHPVSVLPGARKVVVKDFNNDGLDDILALITQGDEQISLYTNAGSFNFRINVLLRFSPVYGSSYFDVADFNKDGHWDIVYTNGDNADYSIVKKPYHGVRVFLNDGRNQFTESWFHHLHGSSMAIARDFDKDGDVDIAAISFFPDFGKTPERGFVYFENNEGKLEPYTTNLAAGGRWLLMEPADIDGDGYTDLLLGALDFDTGVPPRMRQAWTDNPIDVLVLRNKGKK
jgi:hypothetical protein